MQAKITSTKQRKSSGSALLEFSSGLALFIGVVLIPFVDMTFLAARYVIANTYLQTIAQKVAMSDKRSEASSYLMNQSNWRQVIENMGFKVNSANFDIVVCSNAGKNLVRFPGTAALPSTFLPNSVNQKNDPHIYEIELSVNAEIAPMFLGVLAWSKPIQLSLKSRAPWENLSPDPETGKFFINE